MGKTKSCSCNVATYQTYLFPLEESQSGTTPYDQSVFGGSTTLGEGDGFISKFNDQNEILWSSFFGGNKGDEIYSAQILPNENIIIFGITNSDNPQSTPGSSPSAANTNGDYPICLPTGAFSQSTYGGGASDILLASFNSDNELIWSTYFGGADEDRSAFTKGLGSSTQTNIFSITGKTSSSSGFHLFPVGATTDFVLGYGTGASSGFVASFNDDFTQSWCTYLPGEGVSVCYDSEDNLYCIGRVPSITTEITCVEPVNPDAFPICNKPNYYSMPTNTGLSYSFSISAFFENELFWSTFISGNYSFPTCAGTYNNTELYILGTDLSSPNYFPTEPFVDHYYVDTHFPNLLPPPSLNTDIIITRFQINQQAISVSELNDEDEIKAFPNPTTGEINIQFPNIGHKRKISIFNSLGQCVFNIERNAISSFEEIINIQGIPSGIYSIQINSDESIFTSLIVKI